MTNFASNRLIPLVAIAVHLGEEDQVLAEFR